MIKVINRNILFEHENIANYYMVVNWKILVLLICLFSKQTAYSHKANMTYMLLKCMIINNTVFDTVIINRQEIVDIIFILFPFIICVMVGDWTDNYIYINVVKKWHWTFSVNYRMRKHIIVNLVFSIFVTFI